MEVKIPNCPVCDSQNVEEIPDSPLAFCIACANKWNWHVQFVQKYIMAIAEQVVGLTVHEHLLFNMIMLYDISSGTDRYDETLFFIKERLNVRSRD